MFLPNLSAVSYSDPWNIALRDRLKLLGRGKYRIAYFYESANNSTFRYRAYNMTQVINDGNQRDVSASFFFSDDLHVVDEIADLADVLVICRSGFCCKISRLIHKFRVQKKRVLFDIDDLVFDQRYIHLIVNTLGLDRNSSGVWDYWFAYVSRMAETLRLCDGCITTNDFLATRMREYSGMPVSVVPNFINKEQLRVSEEFFELKISSRFETDGKVTLGYFSGSPSHALDYALVLPALEELLEENSRVELVVVGYIEAGAALTRFGKRVTYKPFQDYVNLQRLIGCVDLNLMPLQSNAFTDCKSELKYFEAAIVGTRSIASPAYTYAKAINDGENGYLAQAHQWGTVLRKAIANIDAYSTMAQLAYDDARTKYAWFNQRQVILQAIGLI